MCSWNLEIMFFIFFLNFFHIFSFNFSCLNSLEWTKGRYLVSATPATVFFVHFTGFQMNL